MRWYRVYACRDIPGQWAPTTEWSEQIVAGVGVLDAFDVVRRMGWWPVAVMTSGWQRSEVEP